jgi:hypothetical protein
VVPASIDGLLSIARRKMPRHGHTRSPVSRHFWTQILDEERELRKTRNVKSPANGGLSDLTFSATFKSDV